MRPLTCSIHQKHIKEIVKILTYNQDNGHQHTHQFICEAMNQDTMNLH